MIYYDRVWMGWKLPILCSKIGVSENSGFTHYVFCLTWNMIFQSRVSVHIMLLDNPENYHWRWEWQEVSGRFKVLGQTIIIAFWFQAWLCLKIRGKPRSIFPCTTSISPNLQTKAPWISPGVVKTYVWKSMNIIHFPSSKKPPVFAGITLSPFGINR